MPSSTTIIRSLFGRQTPGVRSRRVTLSCRPMAILCCTAPTRAHWASNTSGNPGAFFNIQDDGNLVVYRVGSQTETADNALWAAGSNDPENRGSPSHVDVGGVGGRGGRAPPPPPLTIPPGGFRPGTGVPNTPTPPLPYPRGNGPSSAPPSIPAPSPPTPPPPPTSAPPGRPPQPWRPTSPPPRGPVHGGRIPTNEGDELGGEGEVGEEPQNQR
jgi:hypothetical protein